MQRDIETKRKGRGKGVSLEFTIFKCNRHRDLKIKKKITVNSLLRSSFLKPIRTIDECFRHDPFTNVILSFT